MMADIYADSVTTPGIQHTFAGKCVFVTGVTGFVGKVLLEKLVRSCPTISQILVLIRPQKTKSSNERFQKLLENSVFDRIKLECPAALGKVRVLAGDVTTENLGLNDQELKLMNEEVNFVFHCAATVRFDDPPRNTFSINFLGVKNVLNVSKSMNKLEAFVHVSTAYSFCNQPVIGEQIYEENISVEQLENILKWMNDEQLQEFSRSVSKTRPSLYQYSKAMAEIYIAENRGELPIVIVRPSVITAAARDPFPGWIDNYNGPTGFIALNSKGFLKTLLVKSDVNADLVPVDLVVNSLIAAARHIAARNHSTALIHSLSCPSGLPVINCVCPPSNSIKWMDVIKLADPLIHKYPSLQAYRLPGGYATSSPVLYWLIRCIYHYLPAIIIDSVMFMLWKEVRFVKSYRQIDKVLESLQIYMVQKFMFTSSNMSRLTESVFFADKDAFPIDQNCLDWEKYMEDYVHGVRLYFLKEDDTTIIQAQKRLKRLWYLYFCARMIPICFAVYFLTKRSSRFEYVLPFLSSHIFKPFNKMRSGVHKIAFRHIAL